MSRTHRKILTAELMAMAPESVSNYLMERVREPLNFFNDPLDESAESQLLSRNEALITIALAKYGRYIATVKQIFDWVEPGNALRLACLANQAVTYGPYAAFPFNLFDNQKQTFKWMLTADDLELESLFSNPALGNEFLSIVLARKDGFADLPDDKLCQLIMTLAKNPRMHSERDDEWMDGSLECAYDRVFEDAWALSESVPTTKQFAHVLAGLFDKLVAVSFEGKNPIAVAERWHIPVDDNETAQLEKRDNDIGFLSWYQMVRKGLARLAAKGNQNELRGYLDNQDIAIRACAYQFASLNPEQIRAANERDGQLAFNEMLENQEIWETTLRRQALRDVAWDRVKLDKHASLDSANYFNSMQKQIFAEHSDWFHDDGGPDDRTKAQATLGDIENSVIALSGKLEQQNKVFNQIKLTLERTYSHVGWLIWMVLGAILMLWFRH